jgi:GR25 family glycosyltransferase involved in LPS biosynthesis
MDLSILNKLFDKVFVITIDHEFDDDKFIKVDNLTPTGKDRNKRLIERLEGLDYELYYGVNGSKYKFEHVEPNQNGFLVVKPQGLTLGQMGCAMSHINLYEKISNGPWERVLVLENDCVFLSNIENLETYFNQLPNDWGLVYLGWTAPIGGGNISENIYELRQDNFTYVHCSHCIGLTKEFAKKLYDFNKECYYTADGAYSEIIKQNNEKCYLITPKVSIQENLDCSLYEVDLTHKL